MKKILLGAFALAVTMAVNAQTEVGFADSEEFAEVIANGGGAPDGCVLHDGEYIKWYVDAPTETWKAGGSTFRFKVNGEGDPDNEYGVYVANGAVGSDNPVFGDDQSSQGAPTDKAYFRFYAKADGYLYVLAKVNTGKQYLAYEEGTRVPYYWATYYDKVDDVISYDLNTMSDILEWDADAECYYIQESVTIDYPWGYIEDVFNGVETKDDCVMGVIKFPVTADCEYIFSGKGTKCAVGAYYFDIDGSSEITYVVTDDEGIPTGEEHVICAPYAAGINNVTVAPTTADGAIYNVSGQRLNTLGKGINIVSGKKILVK